MVGKGCFIVLDGRASATQMQVVPPLSLRSPAKNSVDDDDDDDDQTSLPIESSNQCPQIVFMSLLGCVLVNF